VPNSTGEHSAARKRASSGGPALSAAAGQHAGVADLDEALDARASAGVVMDAIHMCHRSGIAEVGRR
jgi:hypothetical protein